MSKNKPPINITHWSIIILLLVTTLFIFLGRSKKTTNIPDDKNQIINKTEIRDKVIDYQVQNNETLETIAKKFNLSTDTIKWANNLTDTKIKPGTVLKILPVNGVLHQAKKGDTIYSIAKKYQTTPEKIINYPFNNFKDINTFELIPDQVMIIPDGKLN